MTEPNFEETSKENDQVRGALKRTLGKMFKGAWFIC